MVNRDHPFCPAQHCPYTHPIICRFEKVLCYVITKQSYEYKHRIKMKAPSKNEVRRSVQVLSSVSRFTSSGVPPSAYEYTSVPVLVQSISTPQLVTVLLVTALSAK